MARYPQGILVACPTPWDEQFELMEDVLREEVRLVLAAGFTHCYVFGTGGEGYAVDTRRFRAVVDVFHEETSGADVNAMVGVIGLSTAQIVERIEYAHDVGFRIFQISLPSWGPLADDELLRFFSDTCGASRTRASCTTTCRERSGSSPVPTTRGSSRRSPTSSRPRPPAAGSRRPRSSSATPASCSTSWARATSRTARCSGSARSWPPTPSSRRG